MPSSTAGYGHSNTVSWQSACWTLAAIALNSILQPADDFCGQFAAEYSLSVRTSPALSLIDMFIIIGQTIQLWRRLPLRRAIHAVAQYRSQSDGEPEVENPSVAWQLTNLGRTFIVRIVALLQTIKLLFGFHGVYGTQVVGAIFFASFVTTELMNYLGRSSPRASPLDHEIREIMSKYSSPKVFRSVILISCIFSAIFWFGVGASLNGPQNPSYFTKVVVVIIFAIPLGTMASFLTLAGWLLFALFIIDYTILTSLLAYGVLWCITSYWPWPLEHLAKALECSPRSTFLWSSYVAGFFLGILIEFTYPIHLETGPVYLRYVYFPIVNYVDKGNQAIIQFGARLMPALLVTIAGAFVVYLAMPSISFYVSRRMGLRSLDKYLWIYVFHFGANIVFGMLYYTIIYVREGTHKSSWAEYLG